MPKQTKLSPIWDYYTETAGHIYSDDRNCLKPENLEKLLFLGENFKY